MDEIKYKCKKCGKKCSYDPVLDHVRMHNQSKFITQLCHDCYSLHSFTEYVKQIEKDAIIRNGKAKCPSCNNLTQVVQKEYSTQKTEWSGICENCGSKFETKDVWDI